MQDTCFHPQQLPFSLKKVLDKSCLFWGLQFLTLVTADHRTHYIKLNNANGGKHRGVNVRWYCCALFLCWVGQDIFGSFVVTKGKQDSCNVHLKKFASQWWHSLVTACCKTNVLREACTLLCVWGEGDGEGEDWMELRSYHYHWQPVNLINILSP